MTFKPLQGPTLRLILALSLLPVAGCATMPPINAILPALNCASLIPPSYREPIAGVPVASVGGSVGSMATALDGQTERLDRANGRTSDVIGIADDCQARQLKLLTDLTPKRPWWKLWGVR